MANTYTLIASNTLSSSAASVTFSSIPNTYTDLVIRGSVRDTTSATISKIEVQFNANSSAIYSHTVLTGNGATASSARKSGAGNTFHDFDNTVDSATATASTFASFELYIPSYTASQNKPGSYFGAQENNNATAFITANANLFRDTAAISSIKFTAQTSFVSGTSFFLYGIKNS